jgi:hypothetical protein
MPVILYWTGTATIVFASLVYLTGHTLAAAGLTVASVLLYAGAILSVE